MAKVGAALDYECEQRAKAPIKLPPLAAGASVDAGADAGGGADLRKAGPPRCARSDGDDDAERDAGAVAVASPKPAKKPFLVYPEQRKTWDALMILLLLYTASVTPYEVAFLTTSLDALFVVNRCVDLYFLADMALSFVTPFRAPWHSRDAGQWVTERSRIARHYLKGWFAIDLISILPFDVVSVAIESEDMKKLTIVRVVRLMRLAKVRAAVLRGPRNTLRCAIVVVCVWSRSRCASF